MDRILAGVRAEYPDALAGSALPEDPGGPSILYVKGTAPQLAHDLIAEEDALVEVVDNQPFSFTELVSRAEAVHERVLEYASAAETAPRVELGGTIEVAAAFRPGKSVADFRSALSPRLANSVSSVEEVPADSFSLFAHDGGTANYSTQCSGFCTSGWNIESTSTGDQGLLTAGHCGFVTHLVPDSGATPWTGVNYQFFHMGTWGDFGIMLESGTVDQNDDFYFEQGSTWDTTAVEAWGDINANERVCFYGRASNDRTCLRVDVVGVSHTGSNSCVGPTTAQKQVRMKTLGPFTFGDSGGGGSALGRAYGIIRGSNSSNTKLYWSALANLPNLGWRVMTSP